MVNRRTPKETQMLERLVGGTGLTIPMPTFPPAPKRKKIVKITVGGDPMTIASYTTISAAEKAYVAREKRGYVKEHHNPYGEPFKWKLKDHLLEDHKIKEHVKVETKQDIEKRAKKAVPKETPHQSEIRTLTERNDLQKKRITSLNKEVKALKSENEQMKKECIFPKGIPGQKKEKPAPNTRFENII